MKRIVRQGETMLDIKEGGKSGKSATPSIADWRLRISDFDLRITNCNRHEESKNQEVRKTEGMVRIFGDYIHYSRLTSHVLIYELKQQSANT